MAAPAKQTHEQPWISSWGSSQTAPYGTETIPAGSLDNATLRETVHLSVGGRQLRLKLSNAFGEDELRLRAVEVGLPAGEGTPGRLDLAHRLAVTFSGESSVAIPAGAEYVSDPIAFPVAPLSDLSVTLSIDHVPPTLTLHAGARATAFVVPGDHAADEQLASALTFTRWYFLAGVDVAASPLARGSIAAFGDSITDGHGATTDANNRWTDVLARRLNSGSSALHLGVVNQGIGGNRILHDGIGPNAMARLARDLLAQDGLRTVILFEGINDLGGLDRTAAHSPAEHQALRRALQTAMQQFVARAHAHQLRVLGATLTPFVGSDYYHPSPATEADRQALNNWIRTSNTFDGVLDFDATLRDPAHPDRLLPAADSGDHLHPGPEGYRLLGESIPLQQLLR